MSHKIKFNFVGYDPFCVEKTAKAVDYVVNEFGYPAVIDLADNEAFWVHTLEEDEPYCHIMAIELAEELKQKLDANFEFIVQ